MNGVEVIGTFGNTGISYGLSIAILIFMILAFIFLCFGFYNLLSFDSDENERIIALFSLLAGIIIIVLISFCWNKSTYYDNRNHQNQRVIVSDKVKLNDFLKRYEIEKVDGKTLLVKNKKKMN